jgi:hypothetical protein
MSLEKKSNFGWGKQLRIVSDAEHLESVVSESTYYILMKNVYVRENEESVRFLYLIELNI